jgi:hypothetical protein
MVDGHNIRQHRSQRWWLTTPFNLTSQMTFFLDDDRSCPSSTALNPPRLALEPEPTLMLSHLGPLPPHTSMSVCHHTSPRDVEPKIRGERISQNGVPSGPSPFFHEAIRKLLDE